VKVVVTTKPHHVVTEHEAGEHYIEIVDAAARSFHAAPLTVSGAAGDLSSFHPGTPQDSTRSKTFRQAEPHAKQRETTRQDQTAAGSVDLTMRAPVRPTGHLRSVALPIALVVGLALSGSALWAHAGQSRSENSGAASHQVALTSVLGEAPPVVVRLDQRGSERDGGHKNRNTAMAILAALVATGLGRRRNVAFDDGADRAVPASASSVLERAPPAPLASCAY
jgi:hypothetical protein